jgi:hypothetical protein
MKKSNAVPTTAVQVLRLKCYHLCVNTRGAGPFDSVAPHYGHHQFELVDPTAVTCELVQAWVREADADGGPTLRHLAIEHRHGVRHFTAQRRGNAAVVGNGCLTFDSYTDYDSVLPGSGLAA